MSLGERIKEYRKLNKLSLQGFGDKVGVTGAYIQQLEKGVKNNPSYSIVTLIERIICKDVESPLSKYSTK